MNATTTLDRPAGGPSALMNSTIIGTLLQLAMVIAGHYVEFIRQNVFALGGMGISLLAGALWARAAARSRGDGAKGGAIVGGVCALIGIAVSFVLGDVEAAILAIGTLSSAVTGAIGGALTAKRAAA